MEEFDIKSLLQHIWSKFYIVIAIFLAVVIAGEVYTVAFQTPKYKSTTKLVLTSENNSTNLTVSDVQISNNLVVTYSEIVKSDNVLNQAIENLNLELPPAELLKKVAVGTTTNTQLITVSVTDTDPAQAQTIAAEIASAFKEEINKIYNIDNIQIVDVANLPNEPYNVNVLKQTIYYFIAGIALGLGATIALFYLDTSIKDSKTVEEKLGLVIMGKIPNMEKK